MSLLTITQENYEKEVINASKTVVIDFWASWCGPCKMYAPIVEQVAEQLSNEVIVGKVNVDEQSGLAAKYNIMSIPTTVIMKNGKEQSRIVGVVSKEELIQKIK